MTKEEGKRLAAKLKSQQAQLDQYRQEQASAKKNLRKAIGEVFKELKQKEKQDSVHKADVGVTLADMRQAIQKLYGRLEEESFKREQATKNCADTQVGSGTRLTDVEAQIKALADTVQTLKELQEKLDAEFASKTAVKIPEPKTPKEAYEQGVGLLTLGDTALARERLIAFLEKHAGGELGGNAQYWLGESYYHDGDYRRAILEFQKVREKYEKSDKVDDALLKLGYSFASLGLKKEAQVFLKELLRRFPRSGIAPKAKEKLGELEGKKKKKKRRPKKRSSRSRGKGKGGKK